MCECYIQSFTLGILQEFDCIKEQKFVGTNRLTFIIFSIIKMPR